MALFPASIFNPRTMENRPGAVYDEEKTKVIFAEDFNFGHEEIVAIEDTLGVNPQGDFDTVGDRLDSIDDYEEHPRLVSKIITASRNATAASGDVSYTGVGFRPTKITALAAVNNTQQYSHGFADVNKVNYCLLRSVSTGKYLLEYLVFIDVASGHIQTAILKSYDADGFTLTWVKGGTPTGNILLSFLCER